MTTSLHLSEEAIVFLSTEESDLSFVEIKLVLFSLFKGLAGKNNLEKARANMIADGLQDLFPKFGSFMREKDEAKKVCIPPL